MPITRFGNLVWEITTTTGAGNLTLGGAKDATWRRFRDEIASGEQVQYVVRPAASNDYELHHGVLTHGAPDTLSRSSTTLQRSSTGGLIDLPAGSHDVMIAPAASRLFVVERLHSGFIEWPPSPLVWDSNTQIRLKAPGRAMINGKLLEWSTDIVRAFTPSTAGQKNVYLYDNAGTPALEINDTNISPVWDADLGYWKKGGGTPDTTRRNVGSIWIWDDAGTRKIMEFHSRMMGRTLEVAYLMPAGNFPVMRAVSGGTQSTSWAAVNLAGFGVPAEATHVMVAAKLAFTTAGHEAILGISSTDRGGAAPGSNGEFTVRDAASTATNRIFFGRWWAPLRTAQTLYYQIQHTSGTSASADIESWGYRCLV